MTSDAALWAVSQSLAEAVAAAAPSVVQVLGRRRPASGIVYAENVVLTMARVLGRDDHPGVRTPDGRTIEAELAGWDPATGLAGGRPGAGRPPGGRRASPEPGPCWRAPGDRRGRHAEHRRRWRGSPGRRHHDRVRRSAGGIARRSPRTALRRSRRSRGEGQR